jgi:four helix bundle protein
LTIKRFEDLEVWKDSRVFVNLVYGLTENDFRKDFGFMDQIRRASISVMNNIAEGFERNNTKEFIKFLTYSKASMAEVRSMLYLALDLKYISNEQFDIIYNLSISIIKRISSLMKYLKKRLES